MPADDAVALITAAGQPLTYRGLRRMIAESSRLFECPDKALVAIFSDRDTDSVTAYLAAMSIGHACGFFGTVPDPAQAALVAAYQPEFVVRAGTWPGTADGYAPAGALPDGTVVYRRTRASAGPIFADLALLLATSGSLGSPKVVRLSRSNLDANAASIATALGIGPAERAITSLPLSHSYGLSVLNSHLYAGASVVVCADRALSRRFWQSVAGNAVTSFAGVPAAYELLRASGFDPGRYPSLATMTQAGGRLAPDLVRHYAELMERKGGSFWVMYGQTEATARIACLPPGNHATRADSAGRVIPGGQLRVEDADGRTLPDGQAGEVVYSGPNVMLGYARSRADLGAGDERGGRLATGDLGYLRDGYLYLTGRTQRVTKILGYRVELDQVEAAFSAAGTARAVTGGDENIVVFVERPCDEHEAIRRRLARQLGFPPDALTVRPVGAIPVTGTGKVDYGMLTRLARTPDAR
jgi:acyl-CoA synthetase (AMP-forming)/AMP-acid ligase II